jgi:hypothetical protein
MRSSSSICREVSCVVEAFVCIAFRCVVGRGFVLSWLPSQRSLLLAYDACVSCLSSELVVSNRIPSKHIPSYRSKQGKAKRKKRKSTRKRKSPSSHNTSSHHLIISSLIGSCVCHTLLSLIPHHHHHHNPSTPSSITSSPCALCATALLKALTTSSGTVSQSKLLV